MENNQKINCTVASCKYNNREKEKCTLEAIYIAPIDNMKIRTADDSMCASYQLEEQ